MSTKLNLDMIRSAVMATAVPEPHAEAVAPQMWPVVTISRQAGIDAEAVAAALAARLNKRSTSAQRWTYFDRSLVDEVASDHHLSQQLVDSHDERDQAWYEEMIHGLGGADPAGAFAVKTAKTVRRLARQGHVIIVGRGAQAILSDLPIAVHVRLFASEQWLAARHAEATGVTKEVAHKELRQLDSDRRRFVKSHFNRDITDPALFHLILNMALLSPKQAAAAIEPLAAE